MAMPLVTSPMKHNNNLLLSFLPMPFTLFFAMLAVLSVFSVVTFVCGSDKLKKFHRETERTTTTERSKANNNLGNRALSMVKMLSWRKVQAEGAEETCEDEDEDEEEALWRKNILMGEKCRPLNFSEPKN